MNTYVFRTCTCSKKENLTDHTYDQCQRNISPPIPYPHSPTTLPPAPSAQLLCGIFQKLFLKRLWHNFACSVSLPRDRSLPCLHAIPGWRHCGPRGAASIVWMLTCAVRGRPLSSSITDAAQGTLGVSNRSPAEREYQASHRLGEDGKLFTG